MRASPDSFTSTRRNGFVTSSPSPADKGAASPPPSRRLRLVLAVRLLEPGLCGALGGEIAAVVLFDALAEREAHEGGEPHRRAGFRGRFLQHLRDRLRRLVHEGLLKKRDLLVVGLEPALDDLLQDVVRLAGVLLAQDRALACD